MRIRSKAQGEMVAVNVVCAYQELGTGRDGGCKRGLCVSGVIGTGRDGGCKRGLRESGIRHRERWWLQTWFVRIRI